MEGQMQGSKRIGFLQPFGMSSPGGGSRILRALVQDSPWEVVSIVTQPEIPTPTSVVQEVHISSRPYFGRVERTRLAKVVSPADALFAGHFRRKLKDAFTELGLSAIHGTVHSPSCLDAYEIASEVALPFHLSVHDDLAYILGKQFGRGRILRRLAEMWNGSRTRFVISNEMGEEYCRRYGNQPFVLASDGLEHIATAVKPLPSKKLRLYFMGLFHYSYTPNLQALLDGLDRLAESNPDREFSVTCRCGSLPDIRVPDRIHLRVLPFASENVVAEDMAAADVLYQPLPFDERHIGLTRFSLSTKMVSYLGSGTLILYHGPSSSAAAKLLTRHNAAVCVNSLESSKIAEALSRLPEEQYDIVHSALRLATSDFRLSDIRRRFWSTIMTSTRGKV